MNTAKAVIQRIPELFVDLFLFARQVVFPSLQTTGSVKAKPSARGSRTGYEGRIVLPPLMQFHHLPQTEFRKNIYIMNQYRCSGSKIRTRFRQSSSGIEQKFPFIRQDQIRIRSILAFQKSFYEIGKMMHVYHNSLDPRLPHLSDNMRQQRLSPQLHLSLGAIVGQRS